MKNYHFGVMGALAEANADPNIPAGFGETATAGQERRPEKPQNPCINKDAHDKYFTTLTRDYKKEEIWKLKQNVIAKYQCLKLTKTTGTLKCTCDEPTSYPQMSGIPFTPLDFEQSNAGNFSIVKPWPRNPKAQNPQGPGADTKIL